MNAQKLVGDDSQIVQWLKEEIARKESEIKGAQRQYKEMLESKYELESPAAADNGSMQKLEEEMKQIKVMLQQYGGQGK